MGTTYDSHGCCTLCVAPEVTVCVLTAGFPVAWVEVLRGGGEVLVDRHLGEVPGWV